MTSEILPRPSWGLLKRFGVEIEYTIVSRDDLSVRPLSPLLICGRSASPTETKPSPKIAWTNELASHVIELKTDKPSKTLHGLASDFQSHVKALNSELEPEGAMLLGGGMHPLMNPKAETVLWPHGAGEIYALFDRIFNCSQHGWSNIQSTHLNLSFKGDEEFGCLHAALRLLVPIIPILAASSPVVEARVTGWVDTRMKYYQTHTSPISFITGDVVPEPIFDQATYFNQIMKPIYAQLKPWDPTGIIAHEWANARGAIPRFDRGSIELRVIDCQESPVADLALCCACVAVIEALVSQKWTCLKDQMSVPTSCLKSLMQDCVKEGSKVKVTDESILRQFGITAKPHGLSGSLLWQHLNKEAVSQEIRGQEDLESAWKVILEQGSLSERIIRTLGTRSSKKRLMDVYFELAQCLGSGTMFVGV